MKNISKILAITSLLSFSLAYSPIAHSKNSDRPETSPPIHSIQLAQSEAECDRALVSVRQTIGQNRDIPVSFRSRNIPNGVWEEGRPANSDKTVQVIMGKLVPGVGMQGNEHQILDVMNSPQFRNSIASQIINACSGVNVVEFVQDRSDYFVYNGLINGAVKQFECIYRDARSGFGLSETWGLVYCVSY